MYEYFYLTMLISAILLGIVTLTSSTISKRFAKIWGYIRDGLMGVTIVALIGFILITSI